MAALLWLWFWALSCHRQYVCDQTTFVIFEITIHSTGNRAGSYTCSDWRDCADQSVVCPGDGHSCVVNCGTGANSEACSGATITCLEAVDCTVLCWGYRACFGAIINANGASSLHVAVLGGNEELAEATINCGVGSNSTCSVSCAVSPSYDYKSCHKTRIDAQSAVSLNLTCHGDHGL